MPGTDDLTLGQLRRELNHLVALAACGERPKPTRINPPDHPMSGHEWEIEPRAVVQNHRNRSWFVRTVDDSETNDAVYVAPPDLYNPAEDFFAMTTDSARQLAMAILAAADRADHQALGVIRLQDRGIKP